LHAYLHLGFVREQKYKGLVSKPYAQLTENILMILQAKLIFPTCPITNIFRALEEICSTWY